MWLYMAMLIGADIHMKRKFSFLYTLRYCPQLPRLEWFLFTIGRFHGFHNDTLRRETRKYRNKTECNLASFMRFPRKCCASWASMLKKIEIRRKNPNLNVPNTYLQGCTEAMGGPGKCGCVSIVTVFLTWSWLKSSYISSTVSGLRFWWMRNKCYYL